jgi:hypothetical protein
MKCTHGVELFLDKGHSCFECEKHAIANGLPIDARKVNIEDYADAMQKATEQGDKVCMCPRCVAIRKNAKIIERESSPTETLALADWLKTRYGSPEARARARNESPVDLDSELTADAERPGARDINGDVDTLRSELKALQKVIIDQRRELAHAAHTVKVLRRAMNEATALLQAEGESKHG